MKQLFIYASMFLIFTNCKNGTKKQENADIEITKKITELYASYAKRSHNLYDHPLTKDLFSTDLEEKLKECIAITEADIKKIKNSPYPTDKPLLLEGDLFTSLYEGYTTYQIKKITLREREKDISMVADVTIALENTEISPKIVWTDTVHVIHVLNQGWRVDNVMYSEKIAKIKGLKTALDNFVSYSKVPPVTP